MHLGGAGLHFQLRRVGAGDAFLVVGARKETKSCDDVFQVYEHGICQCNVQQHYEDPSACSKR